MKEKIEALLKGLGDTADAIADALRQKGIKGYKGQGCRVCPLAFYLEAEGVPKPHVGLYKVSWGDVPYIDNNDTVEHTPATGLFVDRFDIGKYPDLIKE